MTSDRPVHEIKLAQVRAAIWSNTSGIQGTWYSVTVSRVYRQGGTWKDTASFGRDDLPLVAKVAEMAYAWIWSEGMSRKDKGAQRHVGTSE
jgi:hypothetical protein